MLRIIKRLWAWFWQPTARFAWGAIILVGFVGGFIFLGGTLTAIESTETLEFCVSCHEMQEPVYTEYQQSAHFKNASGVRAICSDCHVPHEMGPKLLKKLGAATEVWATLTGVVNTPEKFEAHRWEMANRVWATMLETDSRECRSCHSYEAMDFTKQTFRASEKMQEGHEQGKTCIECHQGVAHKKPKDPNGDDD